METRNAAPALHFDSALLPDGWAENVRLTIGGGRIANLERNAAPRAGDERVGVAIPGMPNLHSHAFQRGMAGFTEFRGPDADNFWSWRTLMYRFVGRMTPEDLEAISALAFVEMLEAGFTRVGEFHYVHHDPAGHVYANPAEMTERVAAAAGETGIALTLLPVFYAHGGFGGAHPNDGQRRFILDLPRFARLLEDSLKYIAKLPDARLGVAPHSLRAVTPEELARVVALAPAGPIHIHAAEQTGEVEQCVEWSGARPVQWLLDNAHVDARWCLVHATHMTDNEIARLADQRRGRGFLPGDRGESRRRHRAREALHRRRWNVRHRHRFERVDRRVRGAQAARVQPATARSRAQRDHGRGHAFHRARVVRWRPARRRARSRRRAGSGRHRGGCARGLRGPEPRFPRARRTA